MNAARLAYSKRLQRTLKVLKSARRPLSTLEIINKARVVAVSAVMSELRQQGYNILCTRRGDTWTYRLM